MASETEPTGGFPVFEIEETPDVEFKVQGEEAPEAGENDELEDDESPQDSEVDEEAADDAAMIRLMKRGKLSPEAWAAPAAPVVQEAEKEEEEFDPYDPASVAAYIDKQVRKATSTVSAPQDRATIEASVVAQAVENWGEDLSDEAKEDLRGRLAATDPETLRQYASDPGSHLQIAANLRKAFPAAKKKAPAKPSGVSVSSGVSTSSPGTQTFRLNAEEQAAKAYWESLPGGFTPERQKRFLRSIGKIK